MNKMGSNFGWHRYKLPMEPINNKPTKGIIALDCDEVLLSYHETFAQIYHRTFSTELVRVSPSAYHSRDMYGVDWTGREEDKKLFNQVWDEHGWRTMPILDESLVACQLLHQAGYELICVTAIPARFIEHRLENLRSHGFPIDRVISTGYFQDDFNRNPKREVIEKLNPLVFVDDLRRNFRDIENVQTKLIFIDHGCHDDPCNGQDIFYHAKYPTLLDFVRDFLLDEEEHGATIQWNEKSC